MVCCVLAKPHKEDGGSTFRYISARTQKELLAKLHRGIESYRDVDLVEDSRMPLGEWLDRWLEEYAVMFAEVKRELAERKAGKTA